MLKKDTKDIGDYQIKPKNKKKKKIIVIIICIILLISLIGILLYINLNPTKEEKPVKKKVKEKEVEVKKLTIVNEDSNERPIAIMIDNNVGNNNHAGLSEAYITYEAIVEGGLTRIMAVFKDRDKNLVIGPVRSSRHYFLDYALENDAIYTHFGWSTFAENDIKSLGVNNINGLYDNAFWRETSIAAPHNVFTTLEKLYNYAKDSKGYNIETANWKLLKYNTDEVNLNTKIKNTVVNEETGKKETVEVDPEGLIVANSVTIPFSYSTVRSYSYDAGRKVYLRNMNNLPHIDKTTGEQLNYKNIIIERVSNRTIDSYGRQDLETTGSGTGYFLTNGYAMEITWEKPSRSGKITYKYKDGKELIVNDGSTFIEVVPVNSNITIE